MKPWSSKCEAFGISEFGSRRHNTTVVRTRRLRVASNRIVHTDARVFGARRRPSARHHDDPSPPPVAVPGPASPARHPRTAPHHVKLRTSDPTNGLGPRHEQPARRSSPRARMAADRNDARLPRDSTMINDDSGPGDLDRDSRYSGSRPDVEETAKGRRENAKKQEAVENHIVDHPGSIRRSHEPVNAIPRLQEVEIARKDRQLLRGERAAQDPGGSRGEASASAFTHFPTQKREKIASRIASPASTPRRALADSRAPFSSTRAISVGCGGQRRRRPAGRLDPVSAADRPDGPTRRSRCRPVIPRATVHLGVEALEKGRVRPPSSRTPGSRRRGTPTADGARGRSSRARRSCGVPRDIDRAASRGQLPSTTRRRRSLSSMACCARRMPSASMGSRGAPSPAVSSSLIGTPPTSIVPSRTSRVVPASGGHDGAVASEQRVEQARLPRVRGPDDRNGQAGMGHRPRRAAPRIARGHHITNI